MLAGHLIILHILVGILSAEFFLLEFFSFLSAESLSVVVVVVVSNAVAKAAVTTDSLLLLSAFPANTRANRMVMISLPVLLAKTRAGDSGYHHQE